MIITHPSNVDELRRRFEATEIPRAPFGAGLSFGGLGIEIKADSLMDADRPSGKYVLPGGRVVARDAIRVREGRFVEYGPEDVDQLLYLGVISEHREMVFYELPDKLMRHFSMPPPSWTEPNYSFKCFS